MVTAALSPNPKIIDLAYDLPVLNQYLDVFNVMTYDYYGAWDKVWALTKFFLFLFCEKSSICLEGKLMTPHWGEHYSLPFLPATPSSPSRTLEGLFVKKWLFLEKKIGIKAGISLF